MKKIVILLMTVAMMLSTLSCGVTPVLMAENVTELSSAEETSAEDAPNAQPLAGTVEASETLRPGTSPAPAGGTAPSPTPASVRPASDAGKAASSTPAQQTTQNKAQTAAQNKTSAGNSASVTDNNSAQTAVVSAAQNAELPDLLTAQNFPDPALLSQLRAQYPEGLTAETIGSVTSFVTETNIHDTTGIELLTGLEELRLVGMNDFISLDVSTMPRLKTLLLSSSALQALDVSKNPQLQWLFFYGVNAGVQAIDLSACPCLEKLYIESQITSLKLNRNPALKKLVLKYCKLDTLDLSGNPELVLLDCWLNLSELDVSHCTKLESLYVSSPITELDLSCNPRLTELSVNADLTELDLSHNPELTLLQCDGNELRTLDLSMLPALERLCCYENSLRTLDLSHNRNLQTLNCSYNALTTLDLSDCSMLGFMRADSQSGVSVAAVEENGQYYLDFASIVGADKLSRVLDPSGAPLFAADASGLLCLGDECPESYVYCFDTGCPLGMLDVTLTVTAPAPSQQEIPDGSASLATPSQPEWKNAYLSFMTEHYVESYDYFLYDLNADGTPELFIVTGEFEPWLTCSIFSCNSDEEVFKVYSYELGHSSLCGLSAEHSLLQVFGHMGYYALFKWTWDGTTFSVETILPEKDYGHEPYPYHTEAGSSLLSYLSMTACGDPSGLDWNGNPQDENHLILAQGPVGQQAGVEPEIPAGQEATSAEDNETLTQTEPCEHHYVITQVLETETTKGCLQHSCSICGDTYFSH